MARLAILSARDLHDRSAWGLALRNLEQQGHDVVGLRFDKNEFWASRRLSDSLALLTTNLFDGGEHRFTWGMEEVKLCAKFQNSNTFREHHLTLLTIMSRLDKSGTFRLQDRETVARQVYLRVASFLLKARPDVLVFDETPHETVEFACWNLATWMKIPILFFQPTVLGPFMRPKTSLGLNGEGRFEPQANLLFPPSAELQELAFAALDRLRRGSSTAQRAAIVRSEKKPNVILQQMKALGRLRSEIFSARKLWPINFSGIQDAEGWVWQLLETLLRRRIQMSQRSAARALDLPPIARTPASGFVLFALHHEPERTSVPEGEPYYNQLDAVLHARELVSPELEILVKEHPTQLSRSRPGFTGRGFGAYDYLRAIPGIRLVGIGEDVIKLIEKSSGVLTLTGNIAIEAAMRGIPAVGFGDPWWDGMPGTHRREILEGGNSLPPRTGPKVVEITEWLASMLGQRLIPGIGGQAPSTYSARVAKLPFDFKKEECRSLEAIILSFLNTLRTGK